MSYFFHSVVPYPFEKAPANRATSILRSCDKVSLRWHAVLEFHRHHPDRRTSASIRTCADSFLDEEHPQLSFQIAGPMPLELDLKQSLLTMRSESQRLNTLSEYFEELLPRLHRTLNVRSKAGGNGHSVN